MDVCASGSWLRRNRAHGCTGSSVADPNRALFESVVRLLAPVLDGLVFVGGCTTAERVDVAPGWRPAEQCRFQHRDAPAHERVVHRIAGLRKALDEEPRELGLETGAIGDLVQRLRRALATGPELVDEVVDGERAGADVRKCLPDSRGLAVPGEMSQERAERDESGLRGRRRRVIEEGVAVKRASPGRPSGKAAGERVRFHNRTAPSRNRTAHAVGGHQNDSCVLRATRDSIGSRRGVCYPDAACATS